ncbi:hypothetical protein ACLQ2Q_11225 [Microbacterium sp. DT81.1]|uniref:hypothetical protein n=1 Tax=Microbacterium sp. DT81.1 TaxID=3393413 RepID=UPI003CFB52F4
MTHYDIWTDDRTGHTFRITKSMGDGASIWSVERDTPTHERLGYVKRKGRKIWAVTSTVPDGKAEQIAVASVEEGWSLITSGA